MLKLPPTKLMAALLCVAALVASSSASQQAPVEGLWLWLDGWQEPPPEDPVLTPWSWGIVANFCREGEVRLASGAIYRGQSEMALGASDGLRIYRGTWKNVEGGVEVRYRLIDSEIPGLDDPQSRRRELSGTATLSPRGLSIPIAVLAKELRYESKLFVSSAALSPRLSSRFVECERGD